MRCRIQLYGWGDSEAIPKLTGKPNPNQQPWAEMWMGAHPDLPSEIMVDGEWEPLNKVIQHFPEEVLGPLVKERFEGKLPFLFKILSAGQPLSIQVHPSKTAAEAGFQWEEEMGIPRNAAHRNFKDNNHKPEIIAALTPFYGLRGFRPLEEIHNSLSSVPELSNFLKGFDTTPDSLRALYETIMHMNAQTTHDLLDPLIQRLKEKHSKQPFAKTSPEYWILRSDACYSPNGLHDRGLLSFFLLNLVTLQPGQGMYLSAGILHAYLEGMGMELMANSNNVLRGGLTPKHVDVEALLKNISFQCGSVEILTPTPVLESKSYCRFASSADEFELQILSGKGSTLELDLISNGPEILCPASPDREAKMTLRDASGELRLKQGSPVLICHGVEYRLSLMPGAEVFRARVPISK